MNGETEDKTSLVVDLLECGVVVQRLMIVNKRDQWLYKRCKVNERRFCDATDHCSSRSTSGINLRIITNAGDPECVSSSTSGSAITSTSIKHVGINKEEVHVF